jgi:hypothetical protein
MTHAEKENWINNKWRPMMGWMYFAVCITDFILFPILWAIFKASVGEPVTPWEPLTLQGAGLFHVAMGAILGVTAWSRGREKIMGAAGELPELNPTSATGPVQPVATKYARITRPSQPPEPVL